MRMSWHAIAKNINKMQHAHTGRPPIDRVIARTRTHSRTYAHSSQICCIRFGGGDHAHLLYSFRGHRHERTSGRRRNMIWSRLAHTRASTSHLARAHTVAEAPPRVPWSCGAGESQPEKYNNNNPATTTLDPRGGGARGSNQPQRQRTSRTSSLG